MNKNILIVLAGGLLIAVIVAVLVSLSLKGGNDQAPVTVTEEPRVQIVVASKDIKLGEELAANNMKWQEWPKNATFPGAVIRDGEDQDITEAISGRVGRAISEGEPVLTTALVNKDQGNFVAATLNEGMRAVAIDVGATSMAGGFIGPGDYVDILLTYTEDVDYDGPENRNIERFIELNFDRYATETILQNVKVLAVDQAATRDEENSGPRVGKTVTLEVDLQGAETLALAGEMGDLSLALRRLGDDAIYKRNYKVVTDARVTNVEDELYTDVKEVEQTSGTGSEKVKIYKGYTVEETEVGGR